MGARCNLNTPDSVVDRRRFHRFDISVPVSVTILSGQKRGKKHIFDTQSLSATGMLLRSEGFLREGDEVGVKIFLRFTDLEVDRPPVGLTVISVSGRVVGNRAQGAAIDFNDDYDVRFYAYNEDGTRTLKQIMAVSKSN